MAVGTHGLFFWLRKTRKTLTDRWANLCEARNVYPKPKPLFSFVPNGTKEKTMAGHGLLSKTAGKPAKIDVFLLCWEGRMHTYTSNGGWNPYLAGAPERVEDNRYFSEQRIRVDWQFMVVTGIFLEKKRL